MTDQQLAAALVARMIELDQELHRINGRREALQAALDTLDAGPARKANGATRPKQRRKRMGYGKRASQVVDMVSDAGGTMHRSAVTKKTGLTATATDTLLSRLVRRGKLRRSGKGMVSLP